MAVKSVTVLYAVVVTPLAGIPKYLTDILFVPAGGAVEKVNVSPDTLYVVGSCTTPDSTTRTLAVLAGATLIVKAVVVPSPLN